MVEAKLYIAGQWIEGASQFDVLNKYTGEVCAKAHAADRVQVNTAVDAARNAFNAGEISIPDRYTILMRAHDILRRRRDKIIDLMIAETGFSRSDNASDFARCEQTLLTSAEEAKRIEGDMIPIAASPGHDGELAFTLRVPLGVVACITPFNSPLNTTAHKIAPAIAAGNSVVLKPASYTPLSAMLLVEVLAEAGLPAGWLNLVNGSGRDTGGYLCEHPDVRYIAFTGSGLAGEVIQRAAGMRRTQMELGSISGTIVCADADIKKVAIKCAATSFRKSGQVCTSLQRLFIEESVIAEFIREFVALAENMRVGDPNLTDTAVGAMISEGEAERADNWVQEAISQGATKLTTRSRSGAIMPPTILTNIKPEMTVAREEIFAPVVCLYPFTDVNAAIDALNDTPFGLAAGIFTRDIDLAMRASRRVEVGLFNINNTSSNRADPMPYGGCKASGFGREGPRAAIRDMTDERLVTIAPT